ncbi:hypothetical protein MNBD_GAMMA17-1380 [hydrothermal vent metagenome]|uniref:Multidrug resistance protein MdtA-like C-terminal permuted SH3 domain-containing protein n=1 Tax=hydrothermal vent metagenome TaxID=652676 RepID=A0A3B1A3J3_9ZZZZ
MQTHLIAPFLLLFVLTSCGGTDHDNHESGPHDHGDDIEHDHSGDDQHVDRSLHIVHFSDNNELFLQYETLVAKRDSVFLAHLTDLTNYTPIPGGFITITLSGGGFPDETFSGKRPVRDGIHIEVALPQYAGQRQLSLHFESTTTTTSHNLGRVTVYPDYATSKNSAERIIPENAIYLEKEAQWQAGLAVQMPIINKQHQLTLPTSAIYQNNSENFIHVLKGGEFFEQRKITISNTDHGKVAILSGVTAKEYVVIKGNHTLLPGIQSAPSEMAHTIDETSDHHH